MQDDKLVSYGVKVTQENKELLQNLMSELDVTGNEFMEALLDTFESESSKEYIAFAKEDYAALQKYTKSINTLFVSLGQKMQSEIDSNRDKFVKLSESKDNNIANQLEQIAQLKQQRDELQESVKQSKAYTDNQVNQISELTGLNKLLEQLNQSLTKERDQLQALVEKQSHSVTQLEELQEKVTLLEQDKSTLTEEKATLTEKNATLTNGIDNLSREHREQVSKLQADHKQAIELQKISLKNDYDELILKQREKHIDEIEEINATAQKDIRDIQIAYHRMTNGLSAQSKEKEEKSK